MALIYIVLAMLAFFVLLLFSPTHLIFNYEEKLKIKMKVLGIKINIFEKDKSKAKRQTSTKKQKDQNPKKDKEKRSLAENLKMVSKLLKTSKDALREIFEKITIEDLTFKLKVGGNQAFSVAVNYGHASAAVYSIFALVNSIKPPKDYEVLVSPDFSSEKSRINFNLELSGRLFYLIFVTLKYAKKINQIIKS